MRIRKFFICCLIAGVAAGMSGCGSRAVKPVPPAAYPTRTHRANPNDILFRAIGLIGTPYRYGGNTPRGGFDCSGLVDYVFRDVAGIDLPRTAEEISRVDAPQIARKQLESGDLVFFHTDGRRVSHVGIYVGKGRFVHAPNEGGTVRLDYLDAPYWREHYSGAKRVLN
ncbi:MAG: C40 family peptidase [Xanthomonadaceae bacterium]|nr:C40 family peptidase [Xanthomonadaceae bacterium]MDE1886122.1 C40 family peptidase [Xanthomonadaceae bacterium]MDE1960731.1 C40 family peptidase [Xanthomonadaceae bacterium]MDE2084168.1 C40 family peptidase [Xanthomonadaceae bacterium]MDE2257636.1 C40 family peptidase [Xanthomonadaceae bacterium]